MFSSERRDVVSNLTSSRRARLACRPRSSTTKLALNSLDACLSVPTDTAAGVSGCLPQSTLSWSADGRHGSSRPRGSVGRPSTDRRSSHWLVPLIVGRSTCRAHRTVETESWHHSRGEWPPVAAVVATPLSLPLLADRSLGMDDATLGRAGVRPSSSQAPWVSAITDRTWYGPFAASGRDGRPDFLQRCRAAVDQGTKSIDVQAWLISQ